MILPAPMRSLRMHALMRAGVSSDAAATALAAGPRPTRADAEAAAAARALGFASAEDLAESMALQVCMRAGSCLHVHTSCKILRGGFCNSSFIRVLYKPKPYAG